MKKLTYSVAVAAFLFCSAAYPQQSVLSCVVKTVSGKGYLRPTQEVRVGTVLDIPIDALKANGSKYEADDFFHTEMNGESTSITIDRETGEFQFSASSGGPLTPGGGTSKSATGVCKAKKLKL